MANWYVGTYRRLKDYADNENNPDSEVEVPAPKAVDLLVAVLGFVASVVVGALANTFYPWLWVAFPLVAALGLPPFLQMLRMGSMGP